MSQETLSAESLEITPSDVEAGVVQHPERVMDARLTQICKNLGEEATEFFYHGSSFPFKTGDRIGPGVQAINDKEGVLHASATTSERLAWAYANDGEAFHGGRGRVFKVVPSDGETARPLGPQFGEVNSRNFTVIDEVNIKPDHQGTLPTVDWSKYTPYIGANHPEDPLYVAEAPPQRNYVEVSPDELPVPELGEEYVGAELERMRIASGRPKM